MTSQNRFAWSRNAAAGLLCAALALSPVARGEIVHLNDGGELEGVVKRNGDGYDVTDSAGKLVHIPLENIKRIEISAKPKGVVETEVRLQSLRRSVDSLSDLKVIVDRYSRFIEQNKDSPIAKEAQTDLDAWRDRLEKQMVKVGSRWVTAEEREELRKNGTVLAAQIRQLLIQGRMKDADTLLQQALEEDPTNLSAAYERGYVAYKQELLPAARKAFEMVAVGLKDHGPTLNNLAVVAWRQNQQLPAINYYFQAMLASPTNRDVLNNVAEALNALPQNQRASAQAQKAYRVFMDQDALLQQQMAKTGLYRWGAAWVEKPQMEKLEAIEKEIQKSLDAMSVEFDVLQKKIDAAIADIDANTRRMKSMENASVMADSKGNIFHTTLPTRYYELDRENSQLAADRDAAVVKQTELRARAKQEQQKLPVPKYTAIQRLIGPEGTPLLPPLDAPAAVPAKVKQPELEQPKEVNVIPAPPKEPRTK